MVCLSISAASLLKKVKQAFYLMRPFLILLLLLFFWESLPAQTLNGTSSLTNLFKSRNQSFPQEKIYLHLDKPFYAAGDDIWFRAYLVDAASHAPSRWSKIVYVELLDERDTLMRRLKILDREGLLYGDFPLPDTLKPGPYRIRAYTSYMRNAGEEFFFYKTFYIANSHSYRFISNTDYRVDRNNLVTARLNIRTVVGQPASGRMITSQINQQRDLTFEASSDTSGTVQFSFPLSKLRDRNVLNYTFEDNGRQISETLSMPLLSKEFNLQLFPEGGALLQGVENQVAYKAVGLDGMGVEVNGLIFDSKGTFVAEMGPSHLGMGTFVFRPLPEETYYADVSCQGTVKRVSLPASLAMGTAVIAAQNDENMAFKIVSVGVIPQNESYTLLMHSRGRVVYSKQIAPADMNNLFSLPKASLPEGILTMVLFRGNQPVSERQVFVPNAARRFHIAFTPDKEKYGKRSLVKMRITTTDAQGTPIPASLSLAVTDDEQAPVDALQSNIFSSLLLTSDLKGNVEDPGYYFPLVPDTTGVVDYRTDVLMMTQGWARFNAQDVAEGRNPSVEFPVEISSSISGVLRNLVGLARNASLVMFVPKGKPGNQVFLENTDNQGRFLFTGFEYPDSTFYVLQARGLGGSTNVFATFDSDKVPLTFPAYFERSRSRIYSTNYLKQSLEMFRYDPDARMILLDEVEVTTQRRLFPDEPLLEMMASSVSSSAVFTEQRIMEYNAGSIFQLLLMSGVPLADEAQGSIRLRLNSAGNPTILIDGAERDIDYIQTVVRLEDIEALIIMRDGNEALMWGDNAATNGAIYIKLKRGAKNEVQSPGVFVYMPLGYYKAREFYVPKYDVPETLRSVIPDFRSTVYWNPAVITDSTGVAQVEFYTADPATTYTMTAEGLTANGLAGRSLGVIMAK